MEGHLQTYVLISKFLTLKQNYIKSIKYKEGEGEREGEGGGGEPSKSEIWNLSANHIKIDSKMLTP